MSITQTIVNGSQTAISVGGGNFLTQSGTVARHTFHRSLVLAEGESADAWREVTAAQKAQIEAEDAAWTRPPQAFIDMWNSVWTVRCKFNHFDPLKDHVLGKYDPENAPDAQHPFRAYDDVWLSYEEALRVIEEYQWAPGQTNLGGCLQAAHSRVAVPFVFGAHSQDVRLASIAVYNDDIEEVCFAFGVSYAHGFQISKLDTAFHATASKLRKIHGILPVRADCTFNAWVAGATNLESFRLYGLAGDIIVSACPKLNLETFRYMITKAANTKAITIKVHPEVYAKIGDEGNEEWHALLDKAASKNITIASA